MIVILHSEFTQDTAKEIKKNLLNRFSNNISVELKLNSEGNTWRSDEEWNDLLIILYDERPFPDAGKLFITDFLAKRPDTALLLPVALNQANPIPPEPASAFKALPLDGGNQDNLLNRAGAMLGLCLQGRKTKIFISYRASDGKDIAQQIYDHFSSLGYNPWLDQASEIDGSTKILPGEAVQQEIENALTEANILLLIDTPDSISSKWIKEEIDLADGKLIPILPIVFRTHSDTKKGPRLKALLSLQRWIDMNFHSPNDKTDLSKGDLDRITSELEQYLCEIFMRKCRIPFLVKNNFVEVGYDWNAINKALCMYKSQRKYSSRITQTVHSHCSIYSTIHQPSLNQFKKFICSQPHANHSLFIYDGELLSNDELSEWFDDEMIVLHHQEISALLTSNFTKLGDS